MNEYSISDYGIFNDAITTTNDCSNKITIAKDEVAACSTVVKNQGIFMGPMADQCSNALASVDGECTTIISNLGTMSSYLISTSAAYQNADGNANDLISGIGVGTLNLGASVGSLEAINSGTMVSYTYNGQTFNVTNTSINLDDYGAYIQKKGLYQKAGLLGGRCDMLSDYYAMDMLSGKYTSRSNMADHIGGASYYINKTVRDENVEPIMQYTYEELSKGHPVVLQVTQKRSNEGLRHFVTVVGYKSSVSSYADLTPENMLVIDCYDGKIQTLNERNRNYFNQNGKYYAKAPTDVFLAKINKDKQETVNA